MILNFLKTVIGSLKRRKQFAILSIFSIAFSVVSITCVATYWGLLHTSLPPEKDKTNVRFIMAEVTPGQVGAKLSRRPTVIKAEFLRESLGQIKKIGFDEIVQYQYNDGEEIYYRQRQFEAELFWSTPNLFEVYDFEFIRGKPFRDDTGLPVKSVVISRQLAHQIFGTDDCLDEILNFSNVHENVPLQIVGVIETVGPWSLFFNKDIFLNLDSENKAFPYDLIVQENGNRWEEVNLELQKIALSFNKNHEEQIKLAALPFVEAYAEIKHLDFLTREGLLIPMLILIFFLPAACIIHLLQSLFNDRLEELGIRKAMGANTQHINYQVISESIFLIIIAGLISILISVPFWNLLLDVPMSVVIKDILNWQVFASTMLAFVGTGLVIGWLSSIKLARGSIVKYLNLAGS